MRRMKSFEIYSPDLLGSYVEQSEQILHNTDNRIALKARKNMAWQDLQQVSIAT